MQVLTVACALERVGAFTRADGFVGADPRGDAGARRAVRGRPWPLATGLPVLLLAQAGPTQGLWTDL